MGLGDSAASLKTLILRPRGGVPLASGSSYSVLASMDGTRFDEVALFTANRQGTRTPDVLCRILRVQGAAGGTAPIISVGSERLRRTDDPGPVASRLSPQDEKTAGRPGPDR